MLPNKSFFYLQKIDCVCQFPFTKTIIMANKSIFGILMGIFVFLAGLEMFYFSISTSFTKSPSFTATATCEYITNKNIIVYYGCIGKQNVFTKSNVYNSANVEHCIYNYVGENRELHQCVLSNSLDVDVDDDEHVQFTPHCILGSTKTVYPDEHNACDFAIPPPNGLRRALSIMLFIFSMFCFGLAIIILLAEWKRSSNNERVFVQLGTNDV